MMGVSGDEYSQYNIRGIADKLRRKPKIDKLESLLEKPNTIKLLNIQETHLTSIEDEPPSFKKFKHIFHIIHSFAPLNDRGSGICIFLNKTENIMIQEDLLQGRLLYLSVKNIASEEIRNIFSFYGKSKNTSNEWANHINMIKNKIKQNKLEKVCIIGDFNFVTLRIDRNSHALNAIDNAALQPWTELEDECNLLDSFRITNPKRILYTYTHTDKKAKSRLDRMYVSTDLASKIEASHFDTSCFSDHKIVRVRVANKVERGFGSWIFNNSLLKELEFVTLLRNELRSSANIKHTYESRREFWDFLNMNIQSVARMFATEKAEKKRTEIWEIKKDIARLERLHIFRITEETIAKLTELKAKLAVFEKNKIEGLKLRTKIASYEIGEPKVAYLAKLEKTTGEKNSIFSLKDDQDFLKEGTENLLKITYDFYKKLYTKEPESELEQDHLLSKVRDRVSPDQLEASEKDIDARELFKSLTDLQPNKSPGINGITRELYIFFWPELEEHYIDCIKEVMEKNELCEWQKKGAIRITHKKGNRDELKNYRPITLLNVDLKI
jgi:exonuclease III